MPRKSRPRPRDKEADTAAVSTIALRIQPRASRNEITRMEDGGFKVRLTAPPVDGAANEALVKFLAGEFGIAKSQVEIVSGHTSRDKIVRINGLSSEALNRLLSTRGK